MANEGIMAAPMPMQKQPPRGYVSSLDAYNAASSAMQETDPQAFGEYKSAIGSSLSQLNLKPSEIEAFVTLLEYMLQYPDQYKEVIRAGIEAGAIEEGDFPAEFDQGFVSTMLAALNEQRIQQAQNVSPEAMGPGPQEPMAMKSGGLADAAQALQARGRNRDTMLAHITPQEAEMLRRAGGLGTTNPYTGLKEYGWLSDTWKAVTAPVKAVVNVVKDVAKSPIGKIALTIGATMALGPIAAGFGIGTAGTAAIVGGGMSALSGGNLQDILKGAAFGYIGGSIAPSISGYLPGAAGSVLNQGLTGAALGTGFGLATGMSAKDALKAGAVGGLTGAGVAYGQQQGYLPGGQAAGSRTGAPADGSDLSLGPIESTGGVGTATENLTPVMRQDALTGQQFSVGMDGKEYLVYKDAAGNNQYVRADPVNPSQPMTPRVGPINLSVADKYSPYYKGETAAPADNFLISQAQANQVANAPGYTPNLSAQSQYLMQNPTDFSLNTSPDYLQARAMSPGAGLGLQDTPPVSLSGGFNAPRGGVGLMSAGAGNAPGLTIPQQQDALSFSSPDAVLANQSQLTPQQIESYVTKPTALESFTEGAKGLYDRASDAVVGGYNEYLSPSRPSMQQAEQNALLKADQAVADYQASSPNPTRMGAEAAYKAAYDSNSPGFMSKYAPLAAAGLGATYLAGGFDTPPVDDTPVYDPAYTGTDYMRDNPQAFSGSLYNYQSQGAGAYDPYRATTYAGGQGTAAPGVVTPTGIMQAQYSPEYGRRQTQALQRYYSPFIGTAEPIMAAKGGSIREFPRKSGPINGPGTGTSDDIPAMLSDGEFVFTARAVRNAGNGSRRKGAARMYKLMKSLEKGGMVKG